MRCNSCGNKIIKYPIKGQQHKTLKENLKEKTILWKNLFKIDGSSLILIIIIVFLTLGYNADLEKCEDAIKKPCDFCNKTGCCEYQIQINNAVPTLYNLNATEQIQGLS